MAKGQVIAGRFELLSEIARGGMGIVYRAFDRETGAPAAVKIVHVRQQLQLDRFARECETLHKLHHPHIVRYIAHGDHPIPYLAMEWIQGPTLAARLDALGLDVREAVVVGRHLASALAAAHAASVIHRDLKPSNVIFRDGELDATTLIDFGISRTADGSTLTRTGTVLGTLGYMAPEQTQGARLDGRADVFALGCVLYECLTGRPAFSGANQLAVHAKLCLVDPDPVGNTCAEVPAELEALLAEMLAKAPERRPHAIDVHAALTRVISYAPQGPRRPCRAMLDTPTRPASLAGAATLCCTIMCSPVEASAPPEVLVEVCERFTSSAASLVALQDGSVIARLVGDDPATAERAARLAIALRDVLVGYVIVVTCAASSADAIDRGAVTSTNIGVQAAFAHLSKQRAPTIRLDREMHHRLSDAFRLSPAEDGVILDGVT